LKFLQERKTVIFIRITYHSLMRNKLLFRIPAIFLSSLIFCKTVYAQKPQPVAASTYNFSGLDLALNQNAKALDKNFCVLLYKNSQLIYRVEMGESKANLPMEAGDISKWLTAALTLQLVDEGKLSLDDKVSTYLPIFKTYGKGYITIRQCLTHFTGLSGAGLSGLHGYTTLEAEVNDICAKREISTNPGTEFRYTSAGYAIVGRVLEVITKKPFDRLAKETLFRPLNMMKSSFMATGHAVDPSEGAQVAPAELLNFTSMILNKGLFNGKRILSDSSIAELLKVETTSDKIKSSPIGVDGYNYALGSWISPTDPGLFVAPSLTGSWAFVDYTKGYTAIILVAKSFGDPKKTVFVTIKQAMDSALQ
jgi:CubicO group peptidase (beta-lactamase class C family)